MSLIPDLDTRTAVLSVFETLVKSGDPESAHQTADSLLLLLIDDEEITTAFEKVPRWYA